LHEVQQVEGNWRQCEGRTDTSKMQPTDDTILECLVLSKCGAVSFTFVLLSIEVLDGFVVQKTIGVDAPGCDIPIVHLPAELSSPTGQDDGGNNLGVTLVYISSGKLWTHCMHLQRLR